MLERKVWMKLALSLHVGFMGFLWRVKRPEVLVFPINFDAGLPLAGAKRSCTHQARRAVASKFALILAVILRRNITQVCDAVVVGDAVDVVNIAARPDAMNVKPCQPMLTVLTAFDADVPVSLRHGHKPRTLPFLGKLIAVGPVSENPSIGVVVQKLFQQILRECSVGFSHVSAPSKRCIGQGIDAGANCLFPRNIIGGMG